MDPSPAATAAAVAKPVDAKPVDARGQADVKAAAAAETAEPDATAAEAGTAARAEAALRGEDPADRAARAMQAVVRAGGQAQADPPAEPVAGKRVGPDRDNLLRRIAGKSSAPASGNVAANPLPRPIRVIVKWRKTTEPRT